MRATAWIGATIVGLLASGTLADEAPGGGRRATASIEPRRFVTEHTGVFGGREVRFTATAGETLVRDEEGEPTAMIFSTAYVEVGGQDPASRPVTFLYNGGPGAASLWLHMGAFGPRVIALPAMPRDDGAPPHPVQENPHTILDVSDLVFIDPVGTGYSRPLGEKTHQDFYGIGPDAQSLARFIQAWIEEHGRWNSPRYLAGESYGTTRTGMVTKELLDAHVGLNGVILISGVLDYQYNRFRHGNVMAPVSFLPSYAATAWYHDALPDRPDDLEAFLDEVRHYARTDYAIALISGSRLSPEARRDVIARLHAYTGLSEDYLDRTNLRILPFRFMKELRRKDGLALGRADSRYAGLEEDAAGEYPETDAAVDAIGEAFVAAMHDHNRTFLDLRIGEPYRAFDADAPRQWSWVLGPRPPSGGRFATIVPYLGQAQRRNAEFRILMASGYYDLATPFFAAENALAEPGLVPERIEFVQYESGHLLYLQDDVREAFLSDVRRFIEAPGAPPSPGGTGLASRLPDARALPQ